MKKNMGKIDKVVRLLIAVVIGVLTYSGVISGLLGGILLAVAGIFILTSLIGTCPLYLPFGLSTCKPSE